MLGLRNPRGIWVQLLSIIVKSAIKILVGFCRAGACQLSSQMMGKETEKDKVLHQVYGEREKMSNNLLASVLWTPLNLCPSH